MFKTQHGRIPIDPPILAAIGHRIIEKKRRAAPRRRARRPETRDFFWAQVKITSTLLVVEAHPQRKRSPRYPNELAVQKLK